MQCLNSSLVSINIGLTESDPNCRQDGRTVHLPRRKCLALLVYLALNTQPQRRETLASLLYPDSSNSFAYLRRTLSEIRQSLGDKLLNEEIEVNQSRYAWRNFRNFIYSNCSFTVPVIKTLSGVTVEREAYTLLVFRLMTLEITSPSSLLNDTK